MTEDAKVAAARRLKEELDGILRVAASVRYTQFDSTSLVNLAQGTLDLLRLDSRMLARALVVNELMRIEKVDLKQLFSAPDKYFQALRVMETPEKLGRTTTINRPNYLAGLLTYIQLLNTKAS